MKDFATDKTGIINVQLFDELEGTLISEVSFDESIWTPGDFQEEVITVPTTHYTLPAGHALVLRVYVFRDADDDMWFAYDTDTYNSRIDVPTDTYINADWVKTYNATAETNIFSPGESVLVRANISDPIGSYDISEARITILDPDNNPVVIDQNMVLEETDPSFPSAWKLFNFTYNLPVNATKGHYDVHIQAVESNGVTHNGTTEFVLPRNYDVLVYPDQSSVTEPGQLKDYDITVENVGFQDDYFEINASVSTQSWMTRLFNGTSLIAEDTDGDGEWDSVNASYDYDSDGTPEIFLNSNDSVQWTLQKVVPLGSEGLIDTTILIATSETDITGMDSASATTASTTAIKTKTTHLHDDGTLDENDPEDLMDTLPPGAGPLGDYDAEGNPGLTIQKGFNPNAPNPPPQKYQDWVLTPEYAKEFHITGDVTVYLWSAMKDFDTTNTGIIVATLYDDATSQQIVTNTATQSTWVAGGFMEVSFIMSGVDYTLQAGNKLILRVYVDGDSDDDMWFAYDTAIFDSRIDLPTDTYVNVDWERIYNATTDMEQYNFTAGEDLVIRGNVSDPFGSYDITGTDITIEDPNGSISVNNVSMALEQTDLSSPSAWKLFNYTHTLPNDAPVGEYKVYVKGIESNGVTHTSLAYFYIYTNVSTEPNNTGVATGGTSINYTHYINNTGRGADRYEITVNSENGFNVTLYDSSDQMIAYDTNGDGIWDWIDPAFDTNGNGNPDTGILLPGESYQVRIEIEIPNGTPASDENTTVIATSATSSGIYDSAWDYTTIPEFHDIVAPLLFMLFIFGFVRYRRKKASKKGKKEEQYFGE
jgi:hypothetical protein